MLCNSCPATWNPTNRAWSPPTKLASRNWEKKTCQPNPGKCPASQNRWKATLAQTGEKPCKPKTGKRHCKPKPQKICNKQKIQIYFVLIQQGRRVNGMAILAQAEAQAILAIWRFLLKLSIVSRYGHLPTKITPRSDPRGHPRSHPRSTPEALKLIKFLVQNWAKYENFKTKVPSPG